MKSPDLRMSEKKNTAGEEARVTNIQWGVRRKRVCSRSYESK
jgi:hypothetical protein